MKLHLLFLSCLFLSSWQQNLYSPYPQFLGNSLSNQLFPLPYSPAFVEELIQQRNLAIFHLLEAKGLLHSNEEESNEASPRQSDVEGRIMKRPNGAESRGAALLLPALLLGSALYGSTSTSYSFVTSTLTSTSTINCIPSASFTLGSSTVACRKRRDIALVRDLLAGVDDAELAPTGPVSVEATSLPDFAINDRLASSLNEKLLEDGGNRQSRAFGFGVARLYNTLFATTTTSTVTTYSFTTTNSKKTVTIGSSLLCMPTGYSVC